MPTVETDFYARFAKVKNPIEFRQEIVTAVNNLALSDFAFVRMNSSGIEGPTFVTNPHEHLEIYKAEGLHRYDRLLPYARQNTRPVFLSNMYPPDAVIDDRVYELNKTFDYFDYYCIPIRACNGHGNVMFTVSLRGMRPHSFQRKVAACKTQLHALCEAIDYVGTCKFPESFTGPDEAQSPSIIPPPLRVLEAVANRNLPFHKVAEELGMTSEAALANLESIKLAFNVKNNHAAIKYAITAKLLTYI